MKKLFILGAVLLCLFGCSVVGIGIEKKISEYETDFSKVTAEKPEISGMENTEFEKQLNTEIEKEISSALVAFDSEAQASSDNVRMGNKCVMQITWAEKYNKNDFISIIQERYVYTGGAHGKSVRIPKNIDVLASKTIKLSDLFAERGYENTLNRLINEELTKKSDEYKDLWAKAEIKESNQTDFYIEENNLVIFFQPYDLSYYARGFVEFHLPLKELSGYMKEEYRRLI